MTTLRQLYSGIVDEAMEANAHDLQFALDALARIEFRKRFTPDKIMSCVAMAQEEISTAQHRMRSFHYPLYREQVISEHGPIPDSDKDHP